MPQPDNTELIAKAREQAGYLRAAAEWRRAMRAVEIADPADAERLAELYDYLATALESAAKDAERLDWLERTAFVLSRYGAGRADIDVHPALDTFPRETVRETIDAARASGAVPDAKAAE